MHNLSSTLAAPFALLGSLLNIRLKQVQRSFAGAGLAGVVGVGAGLVALLMYTFHYFSKSPGNLLPPVGLLLLFAGANGARKDYRLLQMLTLKVWLVCWGEYVVCCLPLLLAALLAGAWLPPLLLVAGLLPVTFVRCPARQKTFGWLPLQILPDHAFEWKSGLRKNFWWWLPVWLGGMAFSFHQGVAFVAITFTGVAAISCYQENEPLPLLTALQRPPKAFLLHKTGMAARLFLFMALPLVLLSGWFHPEQWYIAPVATFLLLVALLYQVLLKYAFYEPASKISTHLALSFIGLGVIVMPLLLPVSLALMCYLFPKATTRLQPYL